MFPGGVRPAAAVLLCGGRVWFSQRWRCILVLWVQGGRRLSRGAHREQHPRWSREAVVVWGLQRSQQTVQGTHQVLPPGRQAWTLSVSAPFLPVWPRWPLPPLWQAFHQAPPRLQPHSEQASVAPAVLPAAAESAEGVPPGPHHRRRADGWWHREGPTEQESWDKATQTGGK